MKITDESVENYVNNLKDEEITKLNDLVRKHLVGFKASLWRGVFWGGTEQTIIGYGDVTYTRSDKKQVDWFIVGIARQKNHLSLYISARNDDGYLANLYAPKLGKVKTGAGRLSFNKLEDVKLNQLAKLLDEVYKSTEIN
jgi:hypothetical protein